MTLRAVTLPIVFCLIVVITSVCSDQLMVDGRIFYEGLGSSAGRQLSQGGSVCAECADKDSVNIVRVSVDSGSRRITSQDSGSAFAVLSSDQDARNFVEPNNPLLTTTIYETFPTVYNGLSITGKRTRISVYYAAPLETAIPFHQDQSLALVRQQSRSNFLPDPVIYLTRYQSNPGALQSYYRFDQRTGQAQPEQRSDIGQSLQLVPSGGSLTSGGSPLPDFVAVTGNVHRDMTDQTVGRDSISGSQGSANSNAFLTVTSKFEGDKLTPNSGVLSQPSDITIGNRSRIMQMGGALRDREMSSETATVTTQKDIASFASNANTFQGITPAPTQNFGFGGDGAGTSGRQVGSDYQSLSAYSFQGSDGYLTLGQATFVAATSGSPFTTVTDRRTISPTIVQPGAQLMSTSRLEAFFVPIKNSRIQGERTRFSYYYAAPLLVDSRSGRFSGAAPIADPGAAFVSLTGTALVEPTPLLPATPVRISQDVSEQAASASQTRTVDLAPTNTTLSSITQASSFGASAGNVVADRDPVIASSLLNGPNSSQIENGTASSRGQLLAAKPQLVQEATEDGFTQIGQESIPGKNDNTKASLRSQNISDTADSQFGFLLVVSNSTPRSDADQPSSTHQASLSLQVTSFPATTGHGDGVIGENGHSSSVSFGAGNSRQGSLTGQPFTAADAGANPLFIARDLDTAYNPTYNSGSQNSFHLPSGPAYTGENQKGDAIFKQRRTATTGDQEHDTARASIHLFSLNKLSGTGASSSSGAVDSSSSPTGVGGYVSSSAVQPYGLSRFSFDPSGKANRTNGALAVISSNSSSSRQTPNGTVQSGFIISNPDTMPDSLPNTENVSAQSTST